MHLFRPHHRLHRIHRKAYGLIVLAEVGVEVLLELLSAGDPDVLTVDLWPSSWRKDAGGGQRWGVSPEARNTLSATVCRIVLRLSMRVI